MPSMQDIEQFVAEVEARTARAKEAAQRHAETTFVQDINNELGSVTVTGTGDLVDITLDTAQLRYTNAATLSREILSALHLAEEKASIGEQAS